MTSAQHTKAKDRTMEPFADWDTTKRIATALGEAHLFAEANLHDGVQVYATVNAVCIRWGDTTWSLSPMADDMWAFEGYCDGGWDVVLADCAVCSISALADIHGLWA